MVLLNAMQERLSLITLNSDEYVRAPVRRPLPKSSAFNIYDALLALCALKFVGRVHLPWNTKN